MTIECASVNVARPVSTQENFPRERKISELHMRSISKQRWFFFAAGKVGTKIKVENFQLFFFFTAEKIFSTNQIDLNWTKMVAEIARCRVNKQQNGKQH